MSADNHEKKGTGSPIQKDLIQDEAEAIRDYVSAIVRNARDSENEAQDIVENLQKDRKPPKSIHSEAIKEQCFKLLFEANEFQLIDVLQSAVGLPLSYKERFEETQTEYDRPTESKSSESQNVEPVHSKVFFQALGNSVPTMLYVLRGQPSLLNEKNENGQTLIDFILEGLEDQEFAKFVSSSSKTAVAGQSLSTSSTSTPSTSSSTVTPPVVESSARTTAPGVQYFQTPRSRSNSVNTEELDQVAAPTQTLSNNSGDGTE